MESKDKDMSKSGVHCAMKCYLKLTNLDAVVIFMSALYWEGPVFISGEKQKCLNILDTKELMQKKIFLPSFPDLELIELCL